MLHVSICLCPLLSVFIFLCLVSNVACVYLSVYCVQYCPCLSFCVLLDTRHRKIDTVNIGHKTQKDRHVSHWTQDTEILCPMLPVSSFCVLCPMLPVSICLCLVPNFTSLYLYVSCSQCYSCLSVSCAQCYPCLSFSILCPMLPVSILLCLVGYKTQKDRHVSH
jgi:hypothetical protein